MRNVKNDAGDGAGPVGRGTGNFASSSKISNAAKEKLAMMELQMRAIKVCSKWVICLFSLSSLENFMLRCMDSGEDVR